MTKMQFCTTSSREYLPFARVLAASIAEHQPDASLYVLLVDDLDAEVDADNEPFECVRNEEIGLELDELHRMYLIHGSQFLPAIKPFFIDHLVRRTGLPTLYLDSDISLYGSLEDVGERVLEHGLVLTPHLLSPLPSDGLNPDETSIANAGIFNAGMMGFGDGGLDALEFLRARLRRECVTDVSRNRVNEQRWLDFAPAYFSCHVLKDPGVNVAYWNLHERPLSRRGDVLMAGEVPLRAFHFSGYDPTNPALLSRFAIDRPRTSLSTQPVVAELCEAFRSALWQAGYDRHRGIPLPFDQLPGGLGVDATLRALYLADVLEAEAGRRDLPPDGYEPSERSSFVAWATEAYPRRGLNTPTWASPAPVEPPRPSFEAEETIRLLARSSAEAIRNLDNRLNELERLVTRMPVPAAASD